MEVRHHPRPPFSSTALLSISALHLSVFQHSLLFTSPESPESRVLLFLLIAYDKFVQFSGFSSFLLRSFFAWGRKKGKKGRSYEDTQGSVSSVVMIHHHPSSPTSCTGSWSWALTLFATSHPFPGFLISSCLSFPLFPLVTIPGTCSPRLWTVFLCLKLPVLRNPHEGYLTPIGTLAYIFVVLSGSQDGNGNFQAPESSSLPGTVRICLGCFLLSPLNSV